MKFNIPLSLKAEHQELHSELGKAIESGGDTSEAAKAVAEVLHSHFLKEEDVCASTTRSAASSS